MILSREEALAHARDCEEQARRDRIRTCNGSTGDALAEYWEHRARWNEQLAREARELAETFPKENV